MNFLLSNKFKKPGWVLLLIGIVMWLLLLGLEFESNLMKSKVIALFNSDFSFLKGTNGATDNSFSGLVEIIENDITDEIITLLIILGGLMVSFSKEKIEDEFIAGLRLSSLKWAFLVNYIVLILATLFVYGISYFNILVFNMFTPLIIFIARFNYLVYKKSGDEE
tara:strand:- start:139 stop:633 length:495 start_codon:yes stop_codon:yes gene_type:complete